MAIEAAARWPETRFIPKQAVLKSAALFESIIGRTSEDVARHIFSACLPPIPPNSTIHDNDCGTLQITGELFTPTPTNPTPSTNLTVHATDSIIYQIEHAKAKALANNWPVHTAVMKAQDLTFPDNTFDISFTNFVIMGLDNRKLAAKHLYRALKPGGTAVVCTWASMPHDLPLKAPHAKIRGEKAPKLRIQWGGDTMKESFVRDFYREGGFEEGKIEIKTFELWHVVEDLKAWAEGMWSFLGDTDEGWTEDEERWDEAVEIVVEEMEKSSDYVKDESGKGGKLSFVAHVGLAKK